VFDTITLNYDQDGNLCQESPNKCVHEDISFKLNQTLWPDHCVIDTDGAKLDSGLNTDVTDLNIKKGFNCQVNRAFLHGRIYESLHNKHFFRLF
jgi:nicotinamidase/pyrazinamidase